MDRSFAFVETLEGVASARAVAASIGTDNPLLAHDPRAGGGICDMSLYLKQDEATRLGRGAVDILLALDTLLELQEAAVHYGGRAGPLNLTMPLRALLVTLIHRGVMAQRALSESPAGRLLLFAPDFPRWTNDAPWLLPRFGSPHRELAEAGFFGSRPVEFIDVPFSPPSDFNDTATDDLWLRVLLVPPAQVVFELAKRLGLTRARKSGRIAVGKVSETLSETLPYLAARGLKFRHFRLPVYPGSDAPPFGEVVQPDRWLEQRAGRFLVDRIDQLGVFPEYAARAIATVVLQHLSAGLRALSDAVKSIDLALAKTFEGAAAPRILMTSGIYGPVGRQLYELCQEKNVMLVDFEHGATTGLAHTTERRLQVSEATTCHMLLASSDRAAASFRRAPHKNCDIRVIGLADQTRKVHWRPLQRLRARRKLRLKGRIPTVMHISGLLFGGNMRSGDDNSVESYVFETEKMLLCGVYGSVNKMVLYKTYPTQRFPHNASYADLFTLPSNVRLVERADFRYTRAAADIIVTNGNQSTLGWCMGAGVPLIQLRSRIVQDLASDELNKAMVDAFFVVDMDEPDWSARLVSLLNRTIVDLQAEWAAKAKFRNGFLPGAIFGPPGSVGRRAANIIAGLNAGK